MVVGGYIYVIDVGEWIFGQWLYGYQYVVFVVWQVVGQEGGYCFDFFWLDVGFWVFVFDVIVDQQFVMVVVGVDGIEFVGGVGLVE